MIRYPFAPLAAVMGLTEPQAARALGLSGKTEQEYRRDGMSELVADRLAVRAGFVPWTVWPAWLEEAERTCARASCGASFVPLRRNQLYCSKRCRTNENRRRNALKRYRTDPAFAEAKRQQCRAYYEACAEYERARKRAAYWADPEAHRARLRDGRSKKKALDMIDAKNKDDVEVVPVQENIGYKDESTGNEDYYLKPKAQVEGYVEPDSSALDGEKLSRPRRTMAA